MCFTVIRSTVSLKPCPLSTLPLKAKTGSDGLKRRWLPRPSERRAPPSGSRLAAWLSECRRSAPACLPHDGGRNGHECRCVSCGTPARGSLQGVGEDPHGCVKWPLELHEEVTEAKRLSGCLGGFQVLGFCRGPRDCRLLLAFLADGSPAKGEALSPDTLAVVQVTRVACIAKAHKLGKRPSCGGTSDCQVHLSRT